MKIGGWKTILSSWETIFSGAILVWGRVVLKNIAHKRTYFDVNFCDKAFYNKNTQDSICCGYLGTPQKNHPKVQNTLGIPSPNSRVLLLLKAAMQFFIGAIPREDSFGGFWGWDSTCNPITLWLQLPHCAIFGGTFIILLFQLVV